MRFVPFLSRLLSGLFSLSLGLCLVHFSSCTSESTAENLSAQQSPITSLPDSIDTISIAFAGDVMMHMPQITASAIGPDSFDFSGIFQYLSPYLADVDLAVANLETTLAGKPYTGYPQFSAPDTLAWFLKQAGFNCIVTANNHSADRGKLGIQRTVQVLDRYGIAHTGTFSDSADYATHPYYLTTIKGVKIAILNYTYGTNGLPVPKPTVVNLLDTSTMLADIKSARAAGAQIVIPVVHWGLEYQLKPNAEQKKIAATLLRAGVDCVVGSHPHVLQPFARESAAGQYQNKWVFYSLGNLVSNQRKPHTDGGGLCKINIIVNKKANTAVVDSTAYFLPTYVHLQRLPSRAYFITPTSKADELKKAWNKADAGQYKVFRTFTWKQMFTDSVALKPWRF